MFESKILDRPPPKFCETTRLPLCSEKDDSQETVCLIWAWTEVVIVGVVALLIFGPKKIPELGGAFGKTLRSFKEGMTKAEEESDKPDHDYDG